ncbi:MAG: hypothetical protein R2764_12480, partial [Bacteroidales bacterium]
MFILQDQLPVPNPNGKYEFEHCYFEPSCGEPDNSFTFVLSIINPCDIVQMAVGGIQISKQPVALLEPNVPIGQPINVCHGMEYTFNAAPGGGCFIFNANYSTEVTTYQWDFFNDGSIDFEGDELNTVSYVFPDEGIYEVSLKAIVAPYAPNNCGANEMIREIFVTEVPTVDAGPDQIISLGNTADLIGSVNGGTPPYTYQWEPEPYICNGQGTLTPTTCDYLTYSTPFTLTVYDDNGCIGTDEVWVFIESDLSVNPIADPDTICFGESIQLYANASGGTGNYTYYWTPPDGLDDNTIANPIATPNSTWNNFYEVIVEDGQNVAEGYVDFVIDPLPEVFAGEDIISCGNPEIYGWYDFFIENTTSFEWEVVSGDV